MQSCNGKPLTAPFKPMFTVGSESAWWCLLRDGLAVAMLPVLGILGVLAVLVVLTWLVITAAFSFLGKTWRWATTKPRSTFTQNVRW